jgi:hypothetical protein
MEKAARGVTPAAPKLNSWLDEIQKITDVDQARKLYVQAQKAKVSEATLDAIKAKVASLNG